MGYVKVGVHYVSGRFVIHHWTFSQLCEQLEGVNDINKEKFWEKQQITLLNGNLVKLIISEGI